MAGTFAWPMFWSHLVVFTASTMPRKAVATMVPAAAKCMIDERNGNHPRRRD
jgi:hypothetical protein